MPATKRDIINSLEKLKKTEGTLTPLLDFYQALLEIQQKVDRKIGQPHPVFPKDTVRNRNIAGEPVLRFEEIVIDWALLRQTYKRVVGLFSKHPGLFGTIPTEILDVSPGRVVNKRTLRAWYRGRELVIGIPVKKETQPLLRAILAAVFYPFLNRTTAALAGSIDFSHWRRGYCPVCGGNPDFSFLTKENAARWLICSRCDTEWLYQRVQCPYCENNDQETLSFFTDDSGAYRLYICEKCKHYIKAIDLRSSGDNVMLPLERITTLDLDRQAQKKGYLPL